MEYSFINTPCSQEFKVEVRQAAAKLDISMAELIRRLLRQYLDNQK